MCYKVLDIQLLCPSTSGKDNNSWSFEGSLVDKPLDYSFPAMPERKSKFSDILLTNIDGQYTLSDKLWCYVSLNMLLNTKQSGNGFGPWTN